MYIVIDGQRYRVDLSPYQLQLETMLRDAVVGLLGTGFGANTSYRAAAGKLRTILHEGGMGVPRKLPEHDDAGYLAHLGLTLGLVGVERDWLFETVEHDGELVLSPVATEIEVLPA